MNKEVKFTIRDPNSYPEESFVTVEETTDSRLDIFLTDFLTDPETLKVKECSVGMVRLSYAEIYELGVLFTRIGRKEIDFNAGLHKE